MDNKNKNKKKIIVNAMTFIRMAGTLLMPVMFNFLSVSVFLVIVGAILLTDLVDGKLARHWGVSTTFGGILDMTADKLFAVALLSVLSFMYPIMLIPLLTEVYITIINVDKVNKGGVGKSSQFGRAKTVALGVSMFTLLLAGMSPELTESLNNVKIDSDIFENITKNLGNIFDSIKEPLLNIGVKLDSKFETIKSEFVNLSKNALDFVNKEEVKNSAIALGILPELGVAVDYKIKSIKEPKSKSDSKIKIAKLLRDKEFIKYLYDEKNYEENKNKPFVEIIDSYNEKCKKLAKDNKSIDK